MLYDSDEQISSLIEAIIRIYNDARPESDCFSVWQSTGVSLRAIEEILTISCYNHSDSESIQFFLPRYRLAETDSPGFVDALHQLLSFTSDINASGRREFIEKCAELHLATYTNIHNGIHSYPELPSPPKSGTAFIDVASGPDFKNFSIISETTHSTMLWIFRLSPVKC
jgi:hypothetical protein